MLARKRTMLKIARGALGAGLVVTALLILSGWTWFWESPGAGLKTGDGKPYNYQWYGEGWEAGTKEWRDIKFNHQFHVQDQELECTECHAGAQDEDHAGLPEMDVCADCHDETDDSTDDMSGCLWCHRFANPNPKCTEEGCPEDDLPDIDVEHFGPIPYKNLRYPTKKSPAGFSHRKHFAKHIACTACHDGIAQDSDLAVPSGKYMPKPKRCFDCHTKERKNFTHKRHTDKGIECTKCHDGIAQDQTLPFPWEKYVPQSVPTATPKTCRNCHEPISTDCPVCHIPFTFSNKVPPSYHRANWKQYHGSAARLREQGVHGKDCMTCHTEVDCVTCHNTQPPSDHTNFWRTRGHGLMAEGNRERCLNCHRQDFCVACHNETTPRTHMGNWVHYQHCTWCHLDSEGDAPESNCRVCHKQALHTTAPHPINAGTLNCFLCHNPATGAPP